MSNNIIINKTHVTNSGNNRLSYKLPRDVTFGKNSLIAITHFNLFYSFFNITAKYQNNKFFYKWFDEFGDLTVLVEVLIPDGYYTVGTLNEYLQREMVQNEHYLETVENNNYIYFIEILANSTYYAVEVRLSSISSMMDFGSGLAPITDYCKAPNSAIWKVPDTFQTPEFIIPSNNNFGKLIGHNAGTLSMNLTGVTINKQYSFLNNYAATVDPSSSFIVTCNLVNNDMSIPNNVLYSFTIPNGVSFGDLISPQTEVIYAKIKEGTYKEINLVIYDQEFNEMAILDPNLLIVMSIKNIEG